MNTRIVLLSGPPGCGKDSVANFLVSTYNFHHFKFADPIREVMESLVGQFDSDFEYALFKSRKITPDLTGRQLMIDFSERFIKPRLGKDAFGKILAERLIAMGLLKENIVISDCGFEDEIAVFVEHYGDWLLDHKIDHNFELWRVYRPGHDFSGDSRSYPNTAYPVAYDIHNNASLSTLNETVDQMILASCDGEVKNAWEVCR